MFWQVSYETGFSPPCIEKVTCASAVQSDVNDICVRIVTERALKELNGQPFLPKE